VLGLGLLVGLGFVLAAPRPAPPTATLPSRLSDQDFWRLVVDSSEPGGTFPRENLTSNELLFQAVIPELVSRTRKGDVYLGVGPEQNFTYIAALQPAMAIIFDIRRDNLLLQLMYKAMFELTDDRADFVSILFARPRPSGLGPRSTAAELFTAFDASRTDDALYRRNLKAIEDNLLKQHNLALSAADLASLESAYDAFRFRGFAVRYSPTYADLMTATDEDGVNRSYLATEANFGIMKSLESRNLVVPVVGDFGGPKAIRAIGAYLRAHGATVSAFYLSNVEQYLYQDRKWQTFCRNVEALPLDGTSTFIRSSNRGRYGFGGGFGRQFGGGFGGFISSLGPMAAETRSCDGETRR
jgi:hypothetical protein